MIGAINELRSEINKGNVQLRSDISKGNIELRIEINKGNNKIANALNAPSETVINQNEIISKSTQMVIIHFLTLLRYSRRARKIAGL